MLKTEFQLFLISLSLSSFWIRSSKLIFHFLFIVSLLSHFEKFRVKICLFVIIHFEIQTDAHWKGEHVDSQWEITEPFSQRIIHRFVIVGVSNRRTIIADEHSQKVSQSQSEQKRIRQCTEHKGFAFRVCDFRSQCAQKQRKCDSELWALCDDRNDCRCTAITQTNENRSVKNPPQCQRTRKRVKRMQKTVFGIPNRRNENWEQQKYRKSVAEMRINLSECFRESRSFGTAKTVHFERTFGHRNRTDKTKMRRNAQKVYHWAKSLANRNTEHLKSANRKHVESRNWQMHRENGHWNRKHENRNQSLWTGNRQTDRFGRTAVAERYTSHIECLRTPFAEFVNRWETVAEGNNHSTQCARTEGNSEHSLKC